MDWLIDSLGQAWSAVVGGALLALFAWAGRGVRRTARAISDIRSQLYPNSGHSLFDRVNNIARTLETERQARRFAWSMNPVPMYECDEHGANVWTNDALNRLFGMSKEEMLGRGWLAGIAEDERAEAYARWQNSVDQRIPYEHTYTVVNQETKRQQRCRTVAHAAVDGGKPVHFFGVVNPA